MRDGIVIDEGALTAAELFASLPRHVADGLTPEQRAAIGRALAARVPPPPPVNIRVTLTLPGRRFYLAILAGKERRSAARRQTDRERHPLHTAGNFLFVLGGAMGFYVLVLLAFLLNSSVLEY